MNASIVSEQQLEKMKTQPGFVAALDQSGDSTPKALAAYGIKDAWSSEAEIFVVVYQMRARIACAENTASS
jgi:fructose-bisphosphate aldolase class I